MISVRKTIRISDLNHLEAILCSYSAFFNVMTHDAIHLPVETKIVGPISYSWMYPIERSLQTLKQYVWNKVRPNCSIVEAFIMNECLTLCSMYKKMLYIKKLCKYTFKAIDSAFIVSCYSLFIFCIFFIYFLYRS